MANLVFVVPLLTSGSLVVGFFQVESGEKFRCAALRGSAMAWLHGIVVVGLLYERHFVSLCTPPVRVKCSPAG